ncbi:DUF5076 domain-containing protein [Brevundimonas sp. 2R-24]|uniref:DUF5076 domain-containing protein n=1 Tax=Peiella sedimenti TaxID=3061083 RepID=A0ABT8SQC5_9CAUL|nr:DUF5076 domain-containing protein [Caulobacteraceae bacterium XZ-24]
MSKTEQENPAFDQEISPPPNYQDNPQAIEVMRAWWMGERAQMTFRPVFSDPRAFGFLLAEASRHLSNVYAETRGMTPEAAMEAILQGWEDGQKVEMKTAMEKPQRGN